jgi:hypothetical protein
MEEDEWKRRLTVIDSQGNELVGEDLVLKEDLTEEDFPVSWRLKQAEDEPERNEDDYIDPLDDPLGPLRRAEAARQEIIERIKLENGPVPVGGISLLGSPDTDGIEPLMLAAMQRQCHMASLMIQCKAPIDHVDREQNDALMYAARAGEASIVADLLEAGSITDRTNKQGKTAADLAHSPFIREMIVKSAVKNCIVPSTIRPPVATEEPGGVVRCRLEGVPPHMLPDMIEETIRALTRRLLIVPKQVSVPADFFSLRPLGVAYAYFGRRVEAERMAECKECVVGGRKLRIILEEVASAHSA